MAEIIAVVNDVDEIIGKSTLDEVHKNGALHRETAVLIVNNEGKIFIQERVDNGKLDISVVGHFPLEETYLQGIIREIREEVGLNITKQDLRELFKIRFSGLNGKNVRFITLFELRGDYKLEDLNLQLEEVKSMKAYSLEELNKMIKENPEKFTTSLIKILEEYSRI
jgi:isopentenyldiphosphate isomerase